MRFTATIRSAGNGGHAVVVPSEVVDTLTGSRPTVVVRINGVDYHSRLTRYSGKTYLGLRQAYLREIGAAAGDEVEIELTEEVVAPEPEPAPPVMTPELDAALTGEVRSAWERLRDDQRLEYLRWIAGAEADARADRVARTVRRLSR